MPSASRSRAAKRHILDVYTEIVREGVAEGGFRPVDERVAAFGLIGMVNWTAWWFDPHRGRNADEIARELAEMAVRSLMVDGERHGRRTPRAVIDGLREGLIQLDRMLGDRPPGPGASGKGPPSGQGARQRSRPRGP